MSLAVGIGFFITRHTIAPGRLAAAVEGAGFESLWLPDHPVFPVQPATPYPLSPDGRHPASFSEMADPFVTLAFMAAATARLRLGTGVALVTQRHPLPLAKTVASLDRFSGGRVLLGVGTGGIPEDVEMYGVRFADRWKYTREAVSAMKALWRDRDASYEGEFVRFPAVRCDPTPAQPGGPPVLIGARLSERTVARVVEWGDGWLPPSGCPPAEVERGRRMIEARCRETGRDPATVGITVFFLMDVSRDTQRAYEEAGADRIVIELYNHPGRVVPREEWPAVREVVVGGAEGPRPSEADTLAALGRLRDIAFG